MQSYNFESKGVLAILPHEVTEQYNDEVVISADEAAEKADKLDKVKSTTMASITISIRWSA